MTIKNLFGTQPSQVPRIRDLGTLAFQDGANATLSGRVVSSYVTEPTVTQTSITRDVTSVTTQPALALNFTNESNGLDRRLTFSRSSTAYRTNRFGLLESVANNTLRYNYDPITHECKGILLENAATNLVLNSLSADASGSPPRMTFSATTDPIGTNTAVMISGTGQTGSFYVSNAGSTTIALTAGSVYTESIWVKPIATTVVGMQYQIHSTAYADAITRTVKFSFINLTITSVTDATVAGTITKHSNGWYKISVTFVPTNSSKGYAGLIYPLDSNSSVFNSFANGQPVFSMWNCQLETGSIHTSPIVTTGASATRALDILTVPNTYYTNNMSVYAEYDLSGVIKNVSADAANNRRHIFYIGFTSPTSINSMFVDSTAVGYSLSQVYSATGPTDNFAYSSIVPSYTAVQRSAVTFEYLPDTTVTTNTFVNQDMSAVATINSAWARGTISTFYLGSNGTVRSLNGHLKKFSLYQAKLTNAQILEMTR